MTALLVDLGGTNVRFALVEPAGGGIAGLTSFACADFPNLAEAVRFYLAGRVVDTAAMAVAAPISGGDVLMTNSHWGFNVSRLQQQLGLHRLMVVNDFAATALAVPHLAPLDLLAIGDGRAQPLFPIGVIGPGTGLGVSAVIPLADGRHMALESEGGHVTMAAADQDEAAVLDVLRRQFGHVSAERVISGQGLRNLYQAVAVLAGQAVPDLPADQIAQRAVAQSCSICVRALDLFFAMLGTVAGNLALTVGAKGGIVLAGGILPRMADALQASRFRQQFQAKGRFCPWLAGVPTHLIRHPDPAIIGLVGLL